MDFILVLLAVLGGLALVIRLAGTLLRLLLASAQSAAAGGLADISARRGDLSTLAERKDVERAARGARRRQGLLAALWLAVLVVPLFLGWAREVYAACSLLWLLPSAPRPTRSPRVR